GSGFWAERVLLTAAHAAPCPSGLQPVEAAALPVSGLTAGQALAMLGVGRGQRLLVTNGAGNTGSLAIQLAAAMGVEVTATASASPPARLRRLGAAQVAAYHDLNWPDQVHGRFDGALPAAAGTAAAALPLVRDGGRLCSLTSDAPPPQRAITSTNLYVRPDAAQLARLAERLGEGRVQLMPEPLPLHEGPAAFTGPAWPPDGPAAERSYSSPEQAKRGRLTVLAGVLSGPVPAQCGVSARPAVGLAVLRRPRVPAGGAVGQR